MNERRSDEWMHENALFFCRPTNEKTKLTVTEVARMNDKSHGNEVHPLLAGP